MNFFIAIPPSTVAKPQEKKTDLKMPLSNKEIYEKKQQTDNKKVEEQEKPVVPATSEPSSPEKKVESKTEAEE